jgi:hypothetical protein
VWAQSRSHRGNDALASATVLEAHRDPHDEGVPVEPNMPWEIGVYRHIEHDRARPVGAAV